MTKKIFFKLLFLLIVSNGLHSQNCDFCESSSFQADLCLNAPSWTYHLAQDDKTYEGLNIIIDEGYIIDSPVTFIDCTIRVNSVKSNGVSAVIKYVGLEDWVVNQGAFSFIDCTIISCPGVSFNGFWLENGSSGPFDTEANLDVEIDGCIFLEGLHLFHANGMNLTFTNNIAFNQKNEILHLKNNFEDKEVVIHGNYLESLSGPAIWIEDKVASFTIGNNGEAKNVLVGNSNSSTKGNRNNIKVEGVQDHVFQNCDFIGDPEYHVNTRASLSMDNCKFYNASEAAIYTHGQLAIENNCEFKNNSLGIHSLSGDMEVSDSEFEDNEVGIKISNANQSSKNIIIEGCTFENEIDYFSTGASNLAHISGNSFNGDQFSILSDRENNYILENNNMDGSGIGAVAFSNGSNPNRVRNNSITNNSIGTLANNENTDLIYLDNCFGNITEDMNLDGVINLDHGGDLIGAGNRFTETLTQNVVASSSVTFPYFYPMSGSNSDPTLEPKGYQHVEDSDGVEDESCGSALEVAPYFCLNVLELQCYEIDAYLQQLVNLIIATQNNTTITQQPINLTLDQINVIRSQYINCWRIVRLHQMENCGDTWPGPDDKWIREGRGLTTSIGYLISMGAYATAESFRLQLEQENLTEENHDFISTQRINIERLQSEEEYVPSSEDLNLLYSIALKAHPLAAYASGLYTILTGDIIVPEIIPYKQVELREAQVTDIEELKVSPIPTSTSLHVSVSKSSGKDISFRLTDKLGKVVLVKRTSNTDFDIDVTHLENGMYFLDAYSDGTKVSEIQKCVISK